MDQQAKRNRTGFNRTSIIPLKRFVKKNQIKQKNKTELNQKLRDFLKYNKNTYLISNCYQNDLMNTRQQTCTLAIFSLMILQTFVCILIKEKDFQLEFK